ncbi:MAG: hypothetical protein IT374_09350 [Polyangiaceae bacterium]|nr:hypothetical protein [Polyangiaceae bacterium]
MRRLATWFSLVALLGGCASSELEPPAVPTAPLAPAAAPPDEPAPVTEPVALVSEPSEQFEDTDPAALTDFKEPLDAYGTWAEDATYGTVWQPSEAIVGADFAPYVSHGHWALDPQERWTWVSDFDPQFGWVVFHYGRWVWIEGRGWSWVPGRQWAPAWVVWRTGDPGYDYVGWAPAPPYFYWRSSVVFWMDTYPPAPYVFCHTRYVFHDHVYAHVVPAARVEGVARGTWPYQGGVRAGAPPEHVLAHPQPGPSVTSGHIPASSWPSGRVALDSRQASFARPRALGRGAPPPRASRSLGFSDGPARPPGQAPVVTPAPPSMTRATPPPRVRPGFSPGVVRPGAPPGVAPPRGVSPGRATSAPHFSPRPSAAPHFSPRPSAAPHFSPRPSAAPHFSPRPSTPSPSRPSTGSRGGFRRGR